MTAPLLALVAMSGLTYVNARVGRGFAYPPLLWTLVWLALLLLDLVMLLAQPFELAPLQPLTCWIIVAGAALFSLGGAAVVARTSLPSTVAPLPPPPPRLVREAIFWLAVAALPALAWQVPALLELSSYTSAWDLYKGLRYGLTLGGGTYGPAAYLVPVVYLNVLFCLWKFQAGGGTADRRRLRCALFLAGAVALLMTGRTFILLLIAVMVGWRLVAGKVSAKRILAVGLGALVAFAVLGFALGKGIDHSLDAGANASHFGRSIVWYAIGPSHGLDWHLLRAFEGSADLGYTLRLPHAVLHRLGVLAAAPLPLVQDFIEAPLPVNVFTFFHPWLADGGVFYALLAPLAFGALHTWALVRARCGSAVARIGYALMLYPLVITPFQDQYLTLASTWLQYAAWVGAAVLASRYVRSRRSPGGDSGSADAGAAAPPG